MGIVYKALHVGLNRLVALKFIRSGAEATAEEVARFRTEAEAVARLQHPNIVQVHAVGECNGSSYQVLEFVAGGSLKARLDGAPVPPRRAAELLLQLARAVNYAHQRAIVHRDLKPANVLLTSEGVPKVSDFGLAKRLDADLGQTRSGALLGTPSYMAPEQAEGRCGAVGPATDVHALGAILYELLTGRPPFQAAAAVDTLEQVRWQEPVRPRSLQRHVPRDLESICLKCLEKAPGHRYGSAGALAEDLERFLQGEPIHARRFHLFDLLGRALSRSQYDVEFHTSSTLVLLFTPIPVLAQLAVSVVPWPAYPMAALGTSLVTLLAFLGLLLRHTRSAALFATKLAERQFWATWLGNLLATVSAALVFLPSVAADGTLNELSLFPLWCIIFGFTLFMMGSIYWGRLYVFGLAYFGLALLLPVRMEWAPLGFALIQSATLLAIGLHLRRLGRQIR
jgi:serine/threonine-protein kinase